MNSEQQSWDVEIRVDPPKSTAQAKQFVMRNKRTGKHFIGRGGDPLKDELVATLLAYQPPAPLDGPLLLWVHYAFPWLKSEPKKNRQAGWKWKDSKPDFDNAQKLLADALTEAGFYTDDRKVCFSIFTKEFADEPFIGIHIEPIREHNTKPWERRLEVIERLAR